MNNLSTIEKEDYTKVEVQSNSLNYIDNIAIQKLLDAIANIIADEYILKVKKEPETFLKNGG